VLACISLKRQLGSAFNQVSADVLVIVLLALTVIFLISQLHRTIFEENNKNSLRNLQNYTKESRVWLNEWFVEMQ